MHRLYESWPWVKLRAIYAGWSYKKPNSGYSIFQDLYVRLPGGGVQVLTADESSSISPKCPLESNCMVGPNWHHCIQVGKIKFTSGLFEQPTNSQHFSTLLSHKNKLSFSFSYLGYYASVSSFSSPRREQHHIWNRTNFGVFSLLQICLFLPFILFGYWN